MIKDFKSFNENVSNNDEKFVAIVDQFYTDFSDIAYKINGIKYNIRLYKSDKVNLNETYYAINVIVNDYELINGSEYLDDIRELTKEFTEAYHKGGKGYPDENIHLVFKFSLSPYRFTSNQELLYKKGDESFDNKEMEKYLTKVKDNLLKFKEAYDNINGIWQEDHNYNLDLNEYLTDEYPFDVSFDELDINSWVDSSISNINDKLGISE